MNLPIDLRDDFYTYDSTLLNDLEQDATITLEVLYGDFTLTSTVSGKQIDGGERDFIVFGYKGIPVGVVFVSARDFLQRAAREGVRFTTEATVTKCLDDNQTMRRMYLGRHHDYVTKVLEYQWDKLSGLVP